MDLADITYLNEEDHREIYERCDPKHGDVLLVKDGVNAGDAAINTFDGEISLLSSVSMLRPRGGLLSSGFLRYFLLSPQGYGALTGQLTGTAIKRIILRKIREMPVPIAPRPEQDRVVTKLDELLSDLDAGVAALTRAKANLKRYRASVLKAAVEGHLTAAWRAEHPGTEPASTLLARILTERRQKWEVDQLAKFAATGKSPPKNWKDKYPEPAPPDTTDLPELPHGWCWASGFQLFSWASGDFLPSSKQKPGPVPVFGGNGVNGSHTECNVESSTLVIGRVGVHCGNVHLTDGRAWVTDNAIFSKTIPLDCPLRFLQLCLLTANLNAQSQGGAQPFVNQRVLNEVAFVLPPTCEQAEIVASLEERMSQIVAAETGIEHSLLRAARLRQSILKQAFEGKLVPQDPADESATALLERTRGASQLASNGTRIVRANQLRRT